MKGSPVKKKIIRQFLIRFGLVILLANFAAGWMYPAKQPALPRLPCLYNR